MPAVRRLWVATARALARAAPGVRRSPPVPKADPHRAWLILVVVAAVGCGDSSPGTGDDAGSDGGAAEDMDAETGPPLDGAPDAPSLDGGCGDGACDDTEGCGDCPEDCGACMPADEFYCLEDSVSVVNVADDIITGDTTLEDGTPVPDTEVWFGPDDVPNGSGIDVRGATIVVPGSWSSGNEYRKWYPLAARFGLTDMCIAGGTFLGLLPLDIGWHDSKGSFPEAIGDNSAPVMFSSPGTTVTGAFITNNHDSVRPATLDGQDGHDWTVAHTWIEYNRDDCIETDSSRGSGRIVDSLLDGCYAAISTRDCDTCDRTGDTYTFDRVLLRMEPMPFPYMWWDRDRDSHEYIEPYTEPVENAGRVSEEGIPFNHGPVFKLNANPDANPRFALRGNVLLLQVMNGYTTSPFPPDELITECTDNTIVWAGEETLAELEAVLEIPPSCAGQVELTDDLSVWRDAVADWHARHPNVGADHLPSIMGDIRIPRWDPQPWPY